MLGIRHDFIEVGERLACLDRALLEDGLRMFATAFGGALIANLVPELGLLDVSFPVGQFLDVLVVVVEVLDLRLRGCFGLGRRSLR
jgi:hypothetical protein